MKRGKKLNLPQSIKDAMEKQMLAEREKQELIVRSEGEKMRRINEADGNEAVNLRVAEQYIGEFGNLAKQNNTMIIPSNIADIASIVATATKVINKSKDS